MGGASGGGGKVGVGGVSVQKSEGDGERDKKLKNLKKVRMTLHDLIHNIAPFQNNVILCVHCHAWSNLIPKL